MEVKAMAKIWRKASVAVLLGASAATLPAYASFATGINSHAKNKAVSHTQTGKKGKGLFGLELSQLSALKNYTFTSFVSDKGREVKTYGDIHSFDNFQLTGAVNTFYVNGQGYRHVGKSVDKVKISSPLSYIEAEDEYTWANRFLEAASATGASVHKTGLCKTAGEQGYIYSDSVKSARSVAVICVSAKTGALLWYKGYAIVGGKYEQVSGFTVTSIGNVKPITYGAKKAKSKATTSTLPVILHSIPATFPTAIPKPPGNLSGASVQGNPVRLWIIITSPQSASDVTGYINSLKGMGFKVYGKQYTNYTTVLKNSQYYVSVSYSTLGPSVVEMTTSVGLLKK